MYPGPASSPRGLLSRRPRPHDLAGVVAALEGVVVDEGLLTGAARPGSTIPSMVVTHGPARRRRASDTREPGGRRPGPCRRRTGHGRRPSWAGQGTARPAARRAGVARRSRRSRCSCPLTRSTTSAGARGSSCTLAAVRSELLHRHRGPLLRRAAGGRTPPVDGANQRGRARVPARGRGSALRLSPAGARPGFSPKPSGGGWRSPGSPEPRTRTKLALTVAPAKEQVVHWAAPKQSGRRRDRAPGAPACTRRPGSEPVP